MRTFSVHGHFYQPPREDPLTGIIPDEAGAAPFPNWNERIHAECYQPNAMLRNFERISFNLGPTLCTWMNSRHPETLRNIVAQDRSNVNRYGVGNALAQAYNHTILPLAPREEKITQVVWGIVDFQHRFGRRPEGMWLPETAADMETLEILSQNGIEFTILAPWQAKGDNLDTTEPYWLKLAGDRRICIFFFNAELSARVSFDPAATINADSFAANLLPIQFREHKTRQGEPQLLLIASDGELYGHHQQLRDLFLARLVDGGGKSAGLPSIYPALWFKRYPPRQNIDIRECTSWSCHHGVSRWLGNCACTPGNGAWKQAMFSALRNLADALDSLFIDELKGCFSEPLQLRNQYIHVVLGEIPIGEFLHEASSRVLSASEEHRIHLLLEMQRERLRMFTSCGWFFDDLDRPEPQNNLAYAAQAVHLARMATGVDLQAEVRRNLVNVISARNGIRADQIFENRLQRAAESRLTQVGFAH